MLSRPYGHSEAGRMKSMKKNPMTQSGIEPATLRFVAQCINELQQLLCLYRRKQLQFDCIVWVVSHGVSCLWAGWILKAFQTLSKYDGTRAETRFRLSGETDESI